jgi:hypothetical protein
MSKEKYPFTLLEYLTKINPQQVPKEMIQALEDMP